MRDKRLSFEDHNRYGFDESGRDGRKPSKALEEAIASSRKHIEDAFKHSMSEEKLGQLKVKVKLAG